MTMTDEDEVPTKWLVERLRGLATDLLADPKTPWIGERDPKKHICWTAADRIEAQAGTIAQCACMRGGYPLGNCAKCDNPEARDAAKASVSGSVDRIADIISDYYDEDKAGRWRKCAEHIASALSLTNADPSGFNPGASGASMEADPLTGRAPVGSVSTSFAARAEMARDEIAKRIAFAHLGDDREWKGFRSHADRFLAYAVSSTPRATTDRNLAESTCEDCPPVGYETDRTRCIVCPRAISSTEIK